jgi:hypothetical protein
MGVARTSGILKLALGSFRMPVHGPETGVFTTRNGRTAPRGRGTTGQAVSEILVARIGFSHVLDAPATA